MKLALRAASILAIAAAALAASAQTPAFAPTSSLYVGDAGYTEGYTFSLTTAMSVSALGFYDTNQDGLVQAHQVGLWNSAGTLLASVTVPSGTAAPLTGTSRYVSLAAPLALAVGTTYTMGAYMGNGSDSVIYFGAANPAKGVSFGAAMVDNGTSTFSRPRIATGEDQGYFGPNLIVTPVVQSTPEPSALAALGLGAVGLLKRRKKA